MASHFRWYGDSETIVPFNATYSFPTQANMATKTTPRISPKNVSTFGPGQPIEITIPAQGYINTANTTLEFDVDLYITPNQTGGNLDLNATYLRFQNGIQSIFRSATIKYGSTNLEDIQEYAKMTRMVIEHTSSNGEVADQTSIAEGIGHAHMGTTGASSRITTVGFNQIPIKVGPVNVRQSMIQGFSWQDDRSPATLSGNTADAAGAVALVTAMNSYYGAAFTVWSQTRSELASNGWDAVPNATEVGGVFTCTRRYQVQLNLGLFQQPKLLPVKYMASQLTIQLVLANASDCIFTQHGKRLKMVAADPAVTEFSTYQTTDPSYQVRNVNFIPEILEFDASYDATLLAGIKNGGIPIKFSSWNCYKYSLPASTSVNYQVPERNRSIKSVFGTICRTNALADRDTGAMFSQTSLGASGLDPVTLQEFQWRIGGRMFPSSPVQCSTTVGGAVYNGGAEAYIEFQKAFNTLGDYRLSTQANALTWGTPKLLSENDVYVMNSGAALLPEWDGKHGLVAWDQGTAKFIVTESEYDVDATITAIPEGETTRFPYAGRAFAGNLRSGNFVFAVDLETSNGQEISGLNAEQQSDINLRMQFSHAQNTDFSLLVHVYYDAMIILHENNVMELIK